MKLLYISAYQFKRKTDGIYALPAYGDQFWQKYLDVFSAIKVLGVQVKDYLDNGTMARISDERISIEIIPSNIHPKDFKNDAVIKQALEYYISQAEAVLIKPSSRKGIMAIKIAEKLKKPYMVELTGDLKLTLGTNPSLLKRLYSPFLHHQIVRAIKNAPFGLYVTEQYLQKIYPISGEMCGVTDSVINYISQDVLNRRIDKISNTTADDEINIGLIGSYHDKRKGLDVALKAISLIKDKKVRLNVLALGVEKDREKWFAFADKLNVRDKLIFPKSCKSTEEVFTWIDTMDMIILPSRSEGLPRCIVEAISRGCPCITSNVCGMPELINPKWCHDPEDYKKLSELITAMAFDAEVQETTARENFEKSKQFLRTTLEEKRNSFLLRFKQYASQK